MPWALAAPSYDGVDHNFKWNQGRAGASKLFRKVKEDFAVKHYLHWVPSCGGRARPRQAIGQEIQFDEAGLLGFGLA